MRENAGLILVHLIIVVVAVTGLFLGGTMDTDVSTATPADDLSGVFERISPDSIFQSIEFLSGLETRRFTSPGVTIAVGFITATLRGFGIPVEYHYVNVRDGDDNSVVVTNVLASLGGADFTGDTLIICAHYDSRVEDLQDPAPGADDNASGVAVLLEAARVLTEAGLRPRVTLAFFGGEEDSVIGSDAFAQQVLDEHKPLRGVINVDMVGYDEYGPKDIVVFSNPQSIPLALEVIGSARLSTRLVVDTTITTDGNSDHVSFWKRGQPAVSIWEGYDHNPDHCTGMDIPGALTPDFLVEITRLVVSAAVHLGGLDRRLSGEREQTQERIHTILAGSPGVYLVSRGSPGDSVPTEAIVVK